MFFHRLQNYNNFSEQLQFLQASEQVVSYSGAFFFFVLVKKSCALVYAHVKNLFALAESICTEADPSPRRSMPTIVRMRHP